MYLFKPDDIVGKKIRYGTLNGQVIGTVSRISNRDPENEVIVIVHGTPNYVEARVNVADIIWVYE